MARAKPLAVSRGLIAACAGLAVANLLGALLGGLLRVGALQSGAATAATAGQAQALHGALMMAGFFASLITLERVVALRRGRWIPLLSGGAGLLALAGQADAAALLWLLTAAGLLELYLWAGRHRAWSLPLAVEASAALALLAGAAAHAQGGQAELARWGWSLFLVLTIAGERRELMRLLPLPVWGQRAFLAGWAGFALVAALLLWRPELGRSLGFALLGLLALWLLRFDLARLQWRAPGWAGHTAICLLVGYGWLLLAAVSGLAGQGLPGGIAWHLLWLGFVFAMVFGHAPIMLPALAGLRPRHSRWALLPLGVLGLSLLLRSAASLWGWPHGLALAGAGHGLALLWFGMTMAWLVAKPGT